MFRKVFLGLAAGVGLLLTVCFAAWFTSTDPQFNPASFEAEPLAPRLATLGEALTLAQQRLPDGATMTMLVLQYDGAIVSGVDLAGLGAPRSNDPFAVIDALDRAALLAAAEDPAATRVQVPIEQLLPAGPSGARHIGTGTNFPEHAEETSSDSVFNFPKFGTATPARTRVAASPDGLLDYEVELCARFDRPITSVEDFDAARKGLFLCADFTDRVALLELADFDNLDSGYGFSDAKSGAGFFPTGPFLVLPTDWEAFVASTRMTTAHNGQARQDARGREMTLDFRALTDKVLADMEQPRFFYQGDFFRLAPAQRIDTDMALMSGTSEGVIFTAPAAHDYIEMLLGYLKAGGPFSGQGLIEVGVPIFLENEIESGHFLQPGDTVSYRSSTLSEIVVDIVPPT
ncbi:MAG: fumarylacetoacetate hydrolase family protein [Pseudomonadota bacterium]